MNEYKSYEQQITEEYNRWSNKYNEAKDKVGTITEQSVAAFMCNAIAAHVAKSFHKHVKEYFEANADY